MNPIAHLRGAVRRHAHLADAAIAAAVLAATAITAFGGHGHTLPKAGGGSAAIAAALLGCGALAVRRRWPLPVLVASGAAAELFLAAVGGSRGVLVLLAPLIALYTVADQVERRRGLLVGGGAVLLLALAHAVHRPAMLGPENLAFIALGGLAIAAGDSSRNRRAYLAEVERRAERAESEREEDARRRVAEERLRIARDLHDCVGHQLALISVQANVAGQAVDSAGQAVEGAGRAVGAGHLAAAEEALAHVKSATRRAMGELRDTVGLLRQPGDPVAPTATPASGLDGLPDLLASLRASGLKVEQRVDGEPAALAPAADLTAYRVVQESLTNVRKHSRQRRARLSLGYAGQRLRITVEDLGDGVAGAVREGREEAGGGHGIVGMRERVLAIGGAFDAGPRPDGTFRVTADLPCQPLRLPLAPERLP
ncbi:sensor histidine kinase [Phaeacidiphilus oryzae]|uniref:sensor histidine kinase n=1 Tax=Phaeacidiphilus oryzae TaxID=348818 RepID=UPI00068F0D65|nr:histidine kinase [Phaeacidiphilus oryzae]